MANRSWPQRPNLNSGHAIHTVNRFDHRKRAAKLGFLLLLALIGIFVIVSAWFSYSINVPRGGSSEAVLVMVKPGMSIDDISQLLNEKQLIRDPFAFRLYARIGPAHGQLKPGPYLLKPSMSTTEIIDYLAAGKLASRQITIPEGRTVAQISTQLAADTDFAGQNFATVATSQPDEKRLLAVLQAPAGSTNPEGMLFPASYTVLKTDGLEVLAQKMFAKFDSDAVPLLTLKALNGRKPNPAAQKLTPYQRLILASMVEKEASSREDREGVAAVFYNRLAAGMRLESDPTINYATGKTVPTAADLRIRSPYNTYLNTGLPPTPICNPSLDAMEAVTFAEPSDNLFFVGKAGKVYFAKTLAEHEANIEKYLK